MSFKGNIFAEFQGFQKTSAKLVFELRQSKFLIFDFAGNYGKKYPRPLPGEARRTTDL